MKNKFFTILTIGLSMLLGACGNPGNGSNPPVGPETPAGGDGSVTNPFSVSEALTEAIKLASGQSSVTGYYVTGTVIEGLDTYNEATPKVYNGRATFHISEGPASLLVYNLNDANNEATFTSSPVKVGDEVLVYGAFKNYNGTLELCYVSGVSDGKLLEVNGTPAVDTPSTELGTPNKEIVEFLGGLATLPLLPEDREWTTGYDTDYECFFAKCEDNGTSGVNALEDQYNALMQQTSWIQTNDDEYTVEEYGYLYTNKAAHDFDFEIQFYTYTGDFNLLIYPTEVPEIDDGGDTGGNDNEEFNCTSTEADGFIAEYLNGVATLPDLPVDHNYAVYDYFDYLYVYCVDNGTPGVNALEDQYNALMQQTSWIQINDDECTVEDYGYIYADPTASYEVIFYSYEGYFVLYIYLQTEDDGGSEGSDDSGFVSTSVVNDSIAAYLDGINFPSLPEASEWLLTVTDESVEAICYDEGTPGVDSMEDLLFASLQSTSWIQVNDDEYTYEEYGYIFADSTYTYEVQFYTYEGIFFITVY